MAYITKQKKEILEVIKNTKNEFSIKDIYEALNGRVGLTTIYRFIESLKESGEVSIRLDKNNEAYFQYMKKCNHENHFYLKCEKCGTLKHVDCECINELNNHIKVEHNFSFNKNNIILNGICSKCQN